MNCTKILFSLMLFFAIVSLNAQEDGKDESNRIYWNDWYRLEWSDFVAEADTGASVAALSSIGLPYKYKSDGEGTMTVEIDVCFLKNESWSKENLRNNLLLQHEQIHFDIAELHRRKIVKGILEASFTKKNYKEKLKEIISKVWKEDYKEMQDKYDKETNFSKVIQEQINWNKFIDQQLRNYNDFTYNEIEVSLINFD